MLIVFEGIDGSGKSTQVNRAVKYIENLLGPESVVQTKDPGGTKLGACIRRILYEEVTTHELAKGVVDLLFLASHIQNSKKVVEPAIAEGKVVVTDRWWYSQDAYASQRSVDPSISEAYAKSHGPRADLVLFLYGDVKTLLHRARSRESETHQSAKSWNDEQKLSAIQDYYFKNYQHETGWFPIDVTHYNEERVWSLVQEIIDKKLKERVDAHGK